MVPCVCVCVCVCMCVYVCVSVHVHMNAMSTCSPGVILLLVLTVMSLPSFTHQQFGSQEWFRRAGL